ncbi:MAG: serpin family protein [Bacteroidetes bacterium]|jgi:serpin B|nr:serpin family protein [Bacteroidota bacterium]
MDDREPPRDLSPQEVAVVEADRSFGLSLYGALRDAEPNENLFISPLSVSMALGMTLNGAEEETFDDMAATLHVDGLSRAEINAGYRDLINLLVDLDPRVTFTIANAIWHRDTFDVEADFLKTNQDHFDATVEGLDFSSDAAVDRMNRWVDEQTNGRISEMVNAPIDPDMMLYLMNALYFQGDWQHQFDAEQTAPADFTRADGSTVEVDMMHQTEARRFAVYENEQLQMIDLPYGDSLFSMTIVLPREEESLASVMAGLDAATWHSWTDGLTPQRLFVAMPRFELEYEQSLVDVLDALGLASALDPERADFSGINPDMNDLHISKIDHRTFLRVDEQGTEAAAATAVGLQPVSAPQTVRVDRPFFLTIRERHSGTILFIGHVLDPAA